MSPRVRGAGPWLITAATITTGICAVAWPMVTGWAAGTAVGTVALIRGVRRFLEEQRSISRTARPDCAGCIGCGGPDCVQRPDETGQP